MLEPKKRPGCSSFLLPGIIFLLALFGLRVVGEFWETEANYKRNYRERVPMLQWAAFINEMKLREPGRPLEEIIKMPPPFPVPPRATCRVLTPEDQTSWSYVHFVIECPGPWPFAVLSNGQTIQGYFGKDPDEEEKVPQSPDGSAPSPQKTVR
jgi:hypothetical protein